MTIEPSRFFTELPDHVEDPYPLYRRYREAGAVHRTGVTPTGESEWTVFGGPEAEAVLRRPAFGRRAGTATGRPGPIIPPDYPTLSRIVDGWLIFMDPPRHTAVRGVVSAWIASETGRPGYQEELTGHIAALVADVSSGASFDVAADCATVAPVLSALALLGVPREDWARLQELVAGLQQGSSFRAGPRAQRLAVAESAAVQLDAYFRASMREGRHGSAPRLAGHLCALGWDDELVVATCVHLLNAGQETTRAVLGTVAKSLAEDPRLRARVAADPSLVPDLVDELIRFDPPAQMVHRWAYADATIGATPIRRGDKVTVLIGAANRDPRLFEEPDRLRLHRSRRRTLSFGMGAHYCAGASIGRTVVAASTAVLAGVLADFRLERVSYSREELNFRGPASLVLTRER